MLYTLKDLLIKMGAPEASEKGRIAWHYFDPETNAMAGHASISLEEEGERLIAVIKQTRENVEDDAGEVHPYYTDDFYLEAERTARPGHYRVTFIQFDGAEYPKPQKAVIELGLSIFHARALDISIRMVEQAFNKQDILDQVVEPAPIRALRQKFTLRRELGPREGYGVVIPFRPRNAVAVAQ